MRSGSGKTILKHIVSGLGAGSFCQLQREPLKVSERESDRILSFCLDFLKRKLSCKKVYYGDCEGVAEGRVETAQRGGLEKSSK